MLVGREEERRKIGALLSSARIGHGGVLVVTGDAGIGKTALLEDARSRADGMRLLSVTGSEAERDLPFAGLAQLLRLGPADLDRLPPPQAEALGVALALRAGDRPDRFAVGAGLLSWVTRQSEDQPLAMIIDDAHLVDRPSQEAIAFATRRLLADAVAVIVAARTGEPCQLVASDLPQLRLTGLDADATRELVDLGLTDQGVAGSAAAELSRRILDLSGGNPLAVRELTSDHQQLAGLPPEAPIPVSAVLADLYARRGAELDADAMTAALVAAAAGEDLAEIARACIHLGIGVSALAPGEAAGLLMVTPERVRFTHPLIRSGLYSTATPAQRRSVHAAIAATLGEDAVDRRAWHRSQAALGPDEPAAADLAGVGQRAAARGAYAVAATAAERAAALSPTSSGRAGRLLAAGTWAWHAGDAARARNLLDRASRLDRTPDMRVRTQRLLAVIAARCGAVDEARDILLTTAAEASDPAEAVACYAEVISVCFYLGDPAAALLAAQRIGPLAEQSDGEAKAVGLMAAGMARVLAGEDGAGLLRRGVQLGSGLSWPVMDPDSYEASWFVMGPLFLRDSSHGRELVEQAVADQRAKSALGSLPHLLFHIARDEATTDRWPNAEANYTEAVALAREFGQTTELAASLAGLAWLEAREGKAEAARAHAAEVLQLSQVHHVYLTEVWARSALGDLALGLGEVAAAVGHYTDVEALLARLGLRDVDLSPVPELVEALLRSGDPGRAADIARGFTGQAEAKGQPWALARAARTRLILGDDSLLDAAYAEASALHEATLDAYEHARTALAYGGRLRRARRRVDARPVLQQALDTFTHLGAKPWADAAADELAATGVQVSRQGASPVSRLTPRELQIAVLLAEGRTTRQVASALFLSPKTVEYHLRHVYTKFAIDSRAELAARLSQA